MKNHNEFISGIPDVWYSGDRNDLWVEYKYLSISKPRSAVIPHLSPKQLHWIRSRRAEGRNCWVIVGYKLGAVLYTELDDMEYGISPEVFLERTLTRKEMAHEIEFFCLEKERGTPL